MLKKSKLVAAALGLLLLSGAGIASAIEPGYYPDDNGGCGGGALGINDQDYNVYAYYYFPAMRNGESVTVYGSLYNRYNQYIGSDAASFSCVDGWVSYSGMYDTGPTWE